jgi:hypothetical protein
VKGSWRGGLVVVIGTALTGIGLGAVMGVIWWWITPTEMWIKVDGGLGAADLSSPTWFAADGWFLIIGVVFGLVLTGISWMWARQHPIALVTGLLLGAALLSVVAWSVGGVLGPPDPNVTATSVAVGATVDGSLGLRALGVLAAPVISALALVSLLLATTSVSDGRGQPVPQEPVGPTGF